MNTYLKVEESENITKGVKKIPHDRNILKDIDLDISKYPNSKMKVIRSVKIKL